MRKIAAICPILLLLLSAVATADMINLNDGKAFEGKIKDFSAQSFEITVRLRANTLEQPVAEIASMTINGDDAFNKAEKALAAGDLGTAVKSYGAALKAANSDWMKQLIEIRRYQAVARSKRIDIAVKAWIKLVETFESCSAILALSPANPGNESVNKSAVDVINSQIKRLAADRKTNRKFIQALLKTKMKIQQAMGDNDGAARTAVILSNIDSADLTGEHPVTPADSSAADSDENSSKTSDARRPSSSTPAAPLAAGKTADLLVLGQLYNAGKYDVVIDSIKENLNKYDDEKLPAALTLLGRAQMEKAKRMNNDKGLLIDSGLNLMRVYAEYNDSESGPEALFYGAKVNELLGQTAGARAALTELAEHYAEEGQAINPWVKKAQQELQALNQAKDD
ncbi:MAG TPA: hypothetical protein PKK48_08505 [Phycisphaerae bacterium]|nr:hypothetical protein [Phycisphaerae bacterium]HPS52415.1 hypothetical protein [Phycisphaerae bacterium]